MEFEQWLVTFGRDLEILVIIWVDLYHVAGPKSMSSLWSIYRKDVGQQMICASKGPTASFPGAKTRVAFAMFLWIVLVSTHLLYNQSHAFFSDVDKYNLTRETVIISNLAGAFWPWVVTLISISRCHLSIHLRTAALAPSLSAQSGRAANFLLGTILRARRGPRVSHQVQVSPSNWVTEQQRVSLISETSQAISTFRNSKIYTFGIIPLG